MGTPVFWDGWRGLRGSWPPRLIRTHGVLLSYCEEIPVEENEVNDSSSKSSVETKPDASPQLPTKSITNSTLTSTGSSEAPVSVRVGSHCLPAAQAPTWQQGEGAWATLRSVYSGGRPRAHGALCHPTVWPQGSRARFLAVQVQGFA